MTNTNPTGLPVYLDCAATTPIEPRVRELVLRYMGEDFGNAGSRTHEYGARAKRAIERAREQVAAVVDASPDEVVFTSGATESCNLAVLGLAPHGEKTGRRHIVVSEIEHKAVLEPVAELERRGFAVTRVRPEPGGWVSADAIAHALREDTLLVAVMHVNNETGILQPLDEIAATLSEHPAYFVVDAAQGFGKELDLLRQQRIDMVALSGHKIHAPSGVGALVLRRRRFTRPPLTPLLWGGGQERGLRPGTIPTPLIAGLGLASELAEQEQGERRKRNATVQAEALAVLGSLGARIHGDENRRVSHVINFSVPSLDSEAALVALRNHAALSNGSACTSQSYQPSHVLRAMMLPDEQIRGALRLSWCHLTPRPDWDAIHDAVRRVI